MKVLAAGSDSADAAHVARALDRHHKKTPITRLVTTVDFQTAVRWASENCVPVTVYEPKPEHGSVGAAIMNQALLRDDRPNAVVAFPGGKEAGDLMNRAMMARVPVYVAAPDRPRAAGSHRAPRSAG